MRRLILSFVMLVALAVPAFATPVTSFDAVYIGSCMGTLVGQTPGFTASCVGQFDGNTPLEWEGSPEIVRWIAAEDPLIGEFYSVTPNDTNTGGRWTYTGGPALTFAAIKYGSVDGSLFEVWDIVPDTVGPVTFDWTSPAFANKVGKTVYAGTSHVSWYDHAQPVPEPGSMSMLGMGLLFCGRLLRKGWAVKK
jgi:hypothetical protein